MNGLQPGRKVILLIGSNIRPSEHIDRVIPMLCQEFQVTRVSMIVETEPFQSSGDNFLNLAVEILTYLPLEDIRPKLRLIEADLGRMRSADKFAPRTMDLDVIVDDNRVVDPDLWEQSYIAVPVSELAPDLLLPDTETSLKKIAIELKKESWMIIHPAPSLD